jgi:hypothetical protein
VGAEVARSSGDISGHRSFTEGGGGQWHHLGHRRRAGPEWWGTGGRGAEEPLTRGGRGGEERWSRRMARGGRRATGHSAGHLNMRPVAP